MAFGIPPARFDGTISWWVYFLLRPYDDVDSVQVGWRLKGDRPPCARGHAARSLSASVRQCAQAHRLSFNSRVPCGHGARSVSTLR